jgi:hypothetical protein
MRLVDSRVTPLGQVASCLGYSDVANVSRAFRR